MHRCQSGLTFHTVDSSHETRTIIYKKNNEVRFLTI